MQFCWMCFNHKILNELHEIHVQISDIKFQSALIFPFHYFCTIQILANLILSGNNLLIPVENSF